MKLSTNAQILRITPLPKIRMVRSDKWKKRPAVIRYWKYADKLRSLKPEVNWEKLSLQFVLPMPKSWSKKKKEEMYLKPHKQTPDLDNLVKAFKDVLLKQDSMVWCYVSITKVWGKEGSIIINPFS